MKTPFDELSVAEKTSVIELKSMFGKSALRDIYSVSSSNATITNEVGDGEYKLELTGPSESARMQSTERGRYIAGHAGEVGIGLRMPAAPTGNQTIKWGLFDDSNGFYFIRDAQGFGVCILRDGVESRVNQASFNKDRLDGTGPSGINIQFTNGHIYNIVFSWYGYGVVKFVIATRDKYGTDQVVIPVHTWFSNGSTSVKNPNLPITVQISSGGGDAGVLRTFISGRQYSILGKYSPINRINSHYRYNVPVTSTTEFQHIFTVRRKNGYASNAVKIDSVNYFANAYMILQLRVNTTLVGGTFENIADQDASETVMECNNTASSFSGGIIVWTSIVPTDRVGYQQVSQLMYNLPEYQNLSLVAKAVQSVNGQVTALLHFSEEW